MSDARVTSNLPLHNGGETNKVKRIAAVFFAVTTFAFGINAYADGGDPAAGKMKAGVCAPCHGASGASPQDLWPNLSAQRTGYIAKQLKAFRDGTRKDPVMEPIAKGLSDQDIDNLAAYFSRQALDPAAAPANPPK
jgi:cytochrome c553